MRPDQRIHELSDEYVCDWDRTASAEARITSWSSSTSYESIGTRILVCGCVKDLKHQVYSSRQESAYRAFGAPTQQCCDAIAESVWGRRLVVVDSIAVASSTRGGRCECKEGWLVCAVAVAMVSMPKPVRPHVLFKGWLWWSDDSPV